MNGMIGTKNGRVFAPGLKGRGKFQNGRVRHGVKNGSIDQTELASLKEARLENRQALSEAKASDGYVSREERVGLHQDMRAVGKMIFDFKHG
jgi:hypothetical protein